MKSSVWGILSRAVLMGLVAAGAVAGQDNSALMSYYPLRIGNEYHYVSWQGVDTTKITTADTMVVNGQTYFVQSSIRPGRSEPWREYYRPDSAAGLVYRWEPYDSSEYVWFNFALAQGDSFVVDTAGPGLDRFGYILSTTDTMHTPAGTFTNCIDLLLDDRNAMDDEFWYTLAPAVGLLRFGGAWVGTHRLVWARVDGVVYSDGSVGVNETIQHTRFTLHPAYPNPFNPSTTIQFDLPVATDVHLAVYDLLGREVAGLTNQAFVPGFHQVVWNARDSRGRELPTGLYIVLLTTPEFKKTIKLLLLK